MTQPTVERVLNVKTAPVKQLREAWKRAKLKHAVTLKAKKIDFDKGFGPALDKWAASQVAFEKDRDSYAGRKKELWAIVKPLARAQLVTLANSWKTDAKAVSKLAGKYLEKVQTLEDPAKAELANLLEEIGEKASGHAATVDRLVVRIKAGG